MIKGISKSPIVFHFKNSFGFNIFDYLCFSPDAIISLVAIVTI